MGRNNAAAIIIGSIALLIGIALRLFIGRRRFYRRNQAGLQGFKNYRSALAIPFFERVLQYISVLLIMIGVFCLGTAIWVGK